MKKIISFFKNSIKFLQDVANDKRIPQQDKVVLLALIGLIISPIDLIPDWIPILGQIDDFLIIALILDYFVRVLDQEILLDHFPYSLKEFIYLKKVANVFSFFAPNILKKRIWKFTGNVYRP